MKRHGKNWRKQKNPREYPDLHGKIGDELMGKIHLAGADNARDLGGLKTTDGKIIQKGHLIRSNRLSRITKKDTDILCEQYHLRKIIDLRTPMEVEQEADVEVPGASYMNIPFFVESMIGISHEKENRHHMMRRMDDLPKMEDLYVMIVENPYCRKQMSKALQQVMHTENGAVLWHCTEGKDRCGLLSAMVLFCLNVSEQDVMEDYLKTNKAAAKRIDQLYQKWRNLGISKGRAERMEGMFIAKEEFMQAALNSMKKEFGSPEAFIGQALEIPEQEIENFREKVLN